MVYFPWKFTEDKPKNIIDNRFLTIITLQISSTSVLGYFGPQDLIDQGPNWLRSLGPICLSKDQSARPYTKRLLTLMNLATTTQATSTHLDVGHLRSQIRQLGTFCRTTSDSDKLTIAQALTVFCCILYSWKKLNIFLQVTSIVFVYCSITYYM